MTALAALLGVGIACGIVLVAGSRAHDRTGGRPPRSPRRGPRPEGVSSVRDLGGIVLVLTRWPVAAIAAGVAGLVLPRSARRSSARRRRCRSHRSDRVVDRDAARHDRRRARPRSRHRGDCARRARADPYRGDRARRRDRTRVAARALGTLADDLAHPIADLVVAALIRRGERIGAELADLLGTLAAQPRDEAAMQLRVEAARARMRTAVRVITGCTIVTAAGLVVAQPLLRRRLRGRPSAQLTLALIATCWGLALGGWQR